MLSRFFRYISLLALAVATAQSSAGPLDMVELTGKVGFSCGTGSGGFENYCSKGENVEKGSFTLTYDPLRPDTNDGEYSGLFRGAITSFVMTVSQVNRPQLTFSLVGRGDIQRDFNTTTGWNWLRWNMVLEEENEVFAPSTFIFNMYKMVWESPNELPPPEYWDWSMQHGMAPVAYGMYSADVNETDWMSSRISARAIPRPVPVPSTLLLLLIGCAGAFVQQKKRPQRK